MGILSEIDMMNRDAEDDAFEVSSNSETVDSFSEEFEPVEPPKSKPQEEEAEEARKRLNLMPPKPSAKPNGRQNRRRRNCGSSRNWIVLRLCRMMT